MPRQCGLARAVRGIRGRRVNPSSVQGWQPARHRESLHRSDGGKGGASRAGLQTLDQVLSSSSPYPGGNNNSRVREDLEGQHQMAGFSLAATGTIPGNSISTSGRTQPTRCSAAEQDIDTVLIEGCSQPGPSLVVWLAWDRLGGGDQLVVAPTNQGQNGSSISTARHDPRPPQHHRNATCQTLRPASFSRSLRLCLLTLSGAGWFMRWNLGFMSPSRTNAALASHRLDFAPGSGCISLPSFASAVVSWVFRERMPEILPSPYLPGATDHGHMLDWSAAPLTCGVNGIDLGCMHDRIKDTGHTGELPCAFQSLQQTLIAPLGCAPPCLRPSP